MLAPLRVTYIFAGPREAVLHALIMKNYGCTHALIGRDHAGVGGFYDKYASHTVFDQYQADEIGIDVRLFHEVFYCTRCDTQATEQTCPHDEQYRINISGTGIRELLRYGVLPPKEIVRPESARVAMQGIQPKGVDENNLAILPIGKTIESVFPYYLTRSRIGGPLRTIPLQPDQLTIQDLETVIMDARENANRIYKEIYNEFTYVSDTLRSAQPDSIASAREAIVKQQKMVIEYLEEKVRSASTELADEFLYQDKEESERELQVARRILNDTPLPLRREELDYRIWNTLPYRRYRGSDEE